MTFPLCDDTKNTPMHLSYLSLSSAGIEKEAVTIFTRYISPDAVRPIPITEPIRNDIVGKKHTLGTHFFF